VKSASSNPLSAYFILRACSTNRSLTDDWISLFQVESKTKKVKKEIITMTLSKGLTIKFMTILGLLSLGACSTVEGVGKDIEAAGNAIEEKAQEASD
jgi:predicted small secreted protein